MSRLIRSFVAVELPETLRYQIRGYIHSLKPLAKNVRWVSPDNLHLTLKFIGERSTETTEQALEALHRAASVTHPFQLSIERFGGFPNLRRPKVLWLGAASQPEPTLNRLQSTIEDILSEIGIEADTKPFRPHLTLGRVRFKEDLSQLQNFVELHPFPVVRFSVNDFVLIRSILKTTGAEYRVLQKYSLQTSK